MKLKQIKKIDFSLHKLKNYIPSIDFGLKIRQEIEAEILNQNQQNISEKIKITNTTQLFIRQ